MAEWKLGRSPDALRTTLGSCVGVVLYSEKHHAGGIAHVLLAEAPQGKIVKKGKYARPAIMSLVQDLTGDGIETDSLSARIFGGASMFSTGTQSFIQNIGGENIRAVKKTLAELKIPITLEESGGAQGRTITVFMDDGRILLRSNGKEKYIYKT